LFGGVSVHVGGGTAPGTERLTVRTVVRDRRGSADPESLPREVRQAMEEALKDPAASSGSRAKSLGPVTVSTVTTTRTYHSLEEMPPEVRQWAEAMLREAPERGSQSIVVTIDGETRTYDRLEDVPEPHRQAVAAARQRGA
jgi:Trp operon repressor